MIKAIARIIKVLQANDSPRQMVWGIILGSLLGLVPGFNLIHVFLLFLIYLLNVNVGIAILSAAVYKIISAVISPLSHLIGVYILTQLPFLTGVWTFLYNLPVVPWTRFYNTVVMGSVVIGCLWVIPQYFLMMKGVLWYRKSVRDKINARLNKMKVVKVIKGSKLAKAVGKANRIRNALK